MIAREDGFTLIEVLAGAVLGSIVMFALFGIVLTGYASVRVSQDTLLGDEDVQLVLTYIQTDIHAASKDPALLVVSSAGPNSGNTLVLTVPDPKTANGRMLTVTYTYATAGSPSVGTLTRSVATVAGIPISTATIARNLKPGLVNVFSRSCSPGCTSVSAAIQFVLNGATVTRTVNASPQLAYP
jgi:Tfp pilus assembly protein PilW